MSALIRAELLKLRTTRVFWVYVLATLAFVPVSVAMAITGPRPGTLESGAGVREVLGSLLVTTLAAVVGAAVGAVIQAQTLTITLAVVWTSLAESLLVGLLPEVGRWLPGGASAALAGTATANGGLLGFWPAAALLAAYALLLVGAGAGAERLRRTEVT
jgi:hypothetical protein